MKLKLTPGQVLGPYKVIRFIGRGGMGQVFEAYEERLDRRVALKIISKDSHTSSRAVTKFIDEARSLAKLNHSNVVSIYAIDKIEGIPFIAMEYIEGVSIDHIRKYFILNSEEALPLCRQMLEGLKALHDKHIIHRDIKPSNIILQKDGAIKFIDFGLAKSLRVNSEDNTETNAFFGTPRYISPEVAMGRPASPASDIWSLGAVLYEFFSGERLVDPEGKLAPLAIIDSFKSFEFQIPATSRDFIQLRFQNILKKMLFPEPAGRYVSIDDILSDLAPMISRNSKIPVNFYNNLTRDLVGYETYRDRLVARSDYTLLKAKRVLTLCLHSEQFQAPADNETDPLFETSESETFNYHSHMLFDAEKMLKNELAGKKNQSYTQTSHSSPPPAVPPLVFFEANSKKGGASGAKSLKLFGRYLAALVVLALVSLGGLLYFNGKNQNFVSSSNSETMASMKESLNKILPPPPADAKNFPVNEKIWRGSASSITFQWKKSLVGYSKRIELSHDRDFSSAFEFKQVSGFKQSLEIDSSPGVYYWRIRDINSEVVEVGPFQFTVISADPPELMLPANNRKIHVPENYNGTSPIRVRFFWEKKKHISRYLIQVSHTLDFRDIVHEKLLESSQTYQTLLHPGSYYWRVRVGDKGGAEQWSPPRTFYIVDKFNN